MKKMSEKLKRIIVSAAILLVCAVVSIALYMSQLQDVSQKTLRLNINGAYGGGRIVLKEDSVPVQRFTPTCDIYHFGTVIERDLAAKGTVTLNLYSEADERLVASSRLNFDEFTDKAFFRDINYIYAKGDTLRAEFVTEYTQDSEGFVYLVHSDHIYPTDSVLTLNGEQVNGTIVITCASDMLGNSFTYVYFVICALMAGLLVLIYNLAFYGKLPFHKLAITALVSVGLIFGFILPAYSAPDEAMHVNQSFSISSYLLGGIEYKDFSREVNYRRPSDENAVFSSRLTTPFTYREILNNFFTTTDDSASASVQRSDEKTIENGIDIAHLPSAIVISVCRLLHLGYVPTVLLGRLANFALFVLCVYFAIKNAPFGKSLFAAISMLPMCLHLGYSYSYDMPVLGLSILLISLFLKYAYTDKKFSWPSLILLTLAAGLLSMLKGIYVFIPLAFLIIPKERFESMKQKKLARPFFYVTVLLFASFGSVNIFSLIGNQIKSITAAPKAAVVITATSSVATATASNYSLSYILHNISQTVYLLANSFVENIKFYLESMLGTTFGYYDTTVSSIWFAVLCLILFAAVLDNSEEKQLNTKSRVSFSLIFVLVTAAAVLGAVTWTKTDAAIIYGLQGRYILPALLPMLLCLKSVRVRISADISRAVVFAACAANCGIMLNLLLSVTKR